MYGISGNRNGTIIYGEDYDCNLAAGCEIEDIFNAVAVLNFIKNIYNDGLISNEVKQNPKLFEDLFEMFDKHKKSGAIHETMLECFEVLNIADYEEYEK